MDESTKAYYDLINAQQQANNEWSAQQAQKAMDYQTEMSNTAHQREVKDLIAAGLNPVLSAGGSGATTGSGIAASAGDGNVTALYGLAKQAIDANMKQAEAMANQAKSVSEAASGSSGKGSGKGSGSGSASGKVSEEKEYPWYVTALGEVLKRKYGVSLDTFYSAYDAVSELLPNASEEDLRSAAAALATKADSARSDFELWWHDFTTPTNQNAMAKLMKDAEAAAETIHDYRSAKIGSHGGNGSTYKEKKQTMNGARSYTRSGAGNNYRFRPSQTKN